MSADEFVDKKPHTVLGDTADGLDSFETESVIVYDAISDADAEVDGVVVDDDPPLSMVRSDYRAPYDDYRSLYSSRSRLGYNTRDLASSDTLPLWGMLAAGLIVLAVGVYGLRTSGETVSPEDVATTTRYSSETSAAVDREAIDRLAASYNPAPVPELGTSRPATPVRESARERRAPERSVPAIPAPAPPTPPLSKQAVAPRPVAPETVKSAPETVTSAPPGKPSVALTRPWGPPIAAAMRREAAPPITSALPNPFAPPERVSEPVVSEDVKPAAAVESVAATPTPVPSPEPSVAPTSAVASTAAVVTPPDRAAIERVLQQYRESYTNLDAPSAAVIWPRVDTRALSRAFSSLSKQDVTFDRCDLSILGPRATARCIGQIEYVRRVGDQFARTRRLSWSFELERVANRWQIAEVTAD